MQVFEYVENANVYSVPFDWDEDDQNSNYVSEIIDTYFGKNKRIDSIWKPIFFGIVNKKQKLGDLGSLVSDESIIFSSKAVKLLMPLLNNTVELLEYPTEVGPYYLVNSLDNGDYLDRQKTDCDRILDNGLCSGINKFMFIEDAIRGKHLFSIPDMPGYRYVSGEFIETCKQHNLQGIYLTDSVKVWDSKTV